MAETIAKIGFELFRYEHLIFGRCSYLDNTLRGTGILAENSRTRIITQDEPGILQGSDGKTEVHVWGTTTNKDKTVMFMSFLDMETAQAVALDIASLSAQINGNSIYMNAPVKVMQ